MENKQYQLIIEDEFVETPEWKSKLFKVFKETAGKKEAYTSGGRTVIKSEDNLALNVVFLKMKMEFPKVLTKPIEEYCN